VCRGALIAGGALPVEKVITARIALGRVVPEGFEVSIDPSGNALAARALDGSHSASRRLAPP
jgi:hypothetical protein